MLATPSFPKISAVGKRILATGGLHAGSGPLRAGLRNPTEKDVPISHRDCCWTPRREKVFGPAPLASTEVVEIGGERRAGATVGRTEKQP